jgi:hypothetical protein
MKTMKIKIKDLVMLGFVFGIAFFLIGAMISRVFPSNEAGLVSYKVASCIKLIGIGGLVTSMIMGGILLEDIDKNLRLLLLILGLVLLLIYTAGSQSLEWNLNMAGAPSDSQSYQDRPTGYGIPGFEVIVGLGAVIITMVLLKKKKNR